jgi:hypothetical protein
MTAKNSVSKADTFKIPLMVVHPGHKIETTKMFLKCQSQYSIHRGEYKTAPRLTITTPKNLDSQSEDLICIEIYFQEMEAFYVLCPTFPRVFDFLLILTTFLRFKERFVRLRSNLFFYFFKLMVAEENSKFNIL